MTQPEYTPQSMVMVRIGSHTYPYRTEPQCTVCQCSYRMDVERALVHGDSYKAIHDAFQSRTPAPPSTDAMKEHVTRGHLPLPQATSRLMLEQRAKTLGKDIEAGVESLVDYGVVSEHIIKKGFQRLQDGEIEPSMGDLLKAMEFQAKLDASSSVGDLSMEAWTEALMEYFEIARRIMPPELWERFIGETSRSPVLKAIDARQSAVPGEVVEE